MTIDKPGLISPPAHPSFVVLHAATMPIEMSNCGTASMTSAPRESVVSAQPPKKPARRPMIVPISTAMPDATIPTSSEVRAPYIVRTKRSRPAASAPNQNVRVRPLRDAEVVGHRSKYGSFCGCPVTRSASGPPKIARRMSTMITTPPTSAALSCLNRAPEELSRAQPASCVESTAVDDDVDGGHRAHESRAYRRTRREYRPRSRVRRGPDRSC